jgi:hypothetical protein
MFKYINILYYFMKGSLRSCMPGRHPIEIRYNSPFIYSASMYTGVSQNLTPRKTISTQIYFSRDQQSQNDFMGIKK